MSNSVVILFIIYKLQILCMTASRASATDAVFIEIYNTWWWKTDAKHYIAAQHILETFIKIK